MLQILDFRAVKIVFVIFFMVGSTLSCASKNNVAKLSDNQKLILQKDLKEGLPAYKIGPGDTLRMEMPYTQNTKFIIMPDDEIEIKFSRTPELNETQRVRPDGLIVLPYIGDVNAAGLSPEKLRKNLIGLYSSSKELDLIKPDIYVLLKDYKEKIIDVKDDGIASFPLIGGLYVSGKSIKELCLEINNLYSQINKNLKFIIYIEKSENSKICIVGAVNSPGFYPLYSPITALEALSLAKGHKDDAELSTIVVIRKKDNKTIAKIIDASESLDSETSKNAFYVSANEIIFVPRMKISKISQIASFIGDILFFRGWGFDLSSF